jgi:hypothetical protein
MRKSARLDNRGSLCIASLSRLYAQWRIDMVGSMAGLCLLSTLLVEDGVDGGDDDAIRVLLTRGSLKFVGLDKCRVQRRAEGARRRRPFARRKLPTANFDAMHCTARTQGIALTSFIVNHRRDCADGSGRSHVRFDSQSPSLISASSAGLA